MMAVHATTTGTYSSGLDLSDVAETFEKEEDFPNFFEEDPKIESGALNMGADLICRLHDLPQLVSTVYELLSCARSFLTSGNDGLILVHGLFLMSAPSIDFFKIRQYIQDSSKGSKCDVKILLEKFFQHFFVTFSNYDFEFLWKNFIVSFQSPRELSVVSPNTMYNGVAKALVESMEIHNKNISVLRNDLEFIRAFVLTNLDAVQVVYGFYILGKEINYQRVQQLCPYPTPRNARIILNDIIDLTVDQQWDEVCAAMMQMVIENPNVYSYCSLI